MTKTNLKPLLDLLKIASISTGAKYAPEMTKAVSFLSTKLKGMGFAVQILSGLKHKAIFAQKIINPKLPTVLIYGHYDVQPPEPLNAWITPPFEPTIRGGKVFARGASDDKGQLMIHIMAVEKLLAQTKNTPPINIKFIIEGEEEIGSISIPQIAKKYAKSLLKCDFLIVSDSEMPARNQPSLDVSLRGVVYMEVILKTAKQDLHSGSFGGVAENPANLLIQLIAKMKNEKGKVLIPGFYKGVVDPKKYPFINKFKITQKEIIKEGKLLLLGGGEPNFTLNERRWFRPTLDINGLSSGFEEEGQKTIIPSQAMAKISMRLVPNQDPREIVKLFSDFVKKHVPKGVGLKIIEHASSYPYIAPVDNPIYSRMATVLTKNFGKKPVMIGVGGSIGFVPIVAKALRVPCVLVGFGLYDDQIHSPNENFKLKNYTKGIQTMIDFYLSFLTK
jgi:acetylornithine deacetylase/succinyl-diaminopimelate desuccinylase-like protein